MRRPVRLRLKTKKKIPGGGYEIPGFTRLKGNTILDPSKYYLIVTEDSAGRIYALYGNSLGIRKAGDLYKDQSKEGQVTAELTISGDDVKATWLNSPSTPISVNDLRFTVSSMGDGYRFRSSEGYYLTMDTYLFGDHGVELTIHTDDDGIGDGEGYLIRNGNRYIYFAAYGDEEKAAQFAAYYTDFWGPAARLPGYHYTISLYEQNDVTVTVDFTKLEDMLNQAKVTYPVEKDGENAAKYTAATWNDFKVALQEAQEAVDSRANTDLTQEDVETLEWNLRNSMNALVERPVYTEPEEYKYLLDTVGQVEAGQKYVLYLGYPSGAQVVGINKNAGTIARWGGVRVTGNELILDTSTVSEESQVWEAVDVGNGKIALKSTYGSITKYLDLDTQNRNDVYVSDTPVGLTFLRTGSGEYEFWGNWGFTWFEMNGGRYAYARYVGTSALNRAPVAFYKKTIVQSSGNQDLDIADCIAPEGSTQDQPFTDAIGGSTNFGSPSLTTFGDGKVAAAATVQWNSVNNYGGTDVVVSVSSNDGWKYKTPLYFNDTVNVYVAQGASFSDPMLTADDSGKFYLLANLFPGGAGKVSGRTTGDAPWSPQQANGYVDIDGEQRLVLYYTAITDQQSDNNYAYYIGDFVTIGNKEYAPVYEYLGGDQYAEVADFYVDKQYNLYEAVENSDPEPMYCRQRAGSGETQKWVQQNVFFFESYLHVRCTNYLVLTTSDNEGETWSDFTILNPMVRENNTEAFYGTAAGGQGIVMGNLVVFPCYSWGNTSGGNQYASFIYSNDGGQTWHRAPQATAAAGSNESSVVKLDDNRLRMFVGDNNAWLEYVDYTWNGQEWSVGGVTILKDVHTTANRQVSAITCQIQDKTMIIISASRSQDNDGKIYTFELSGDAKRTMTLVDTYDMDPNQSNDYFAHSALIGHLSGAEGESLSVLYESKSSPKTLTYTSIRVENIWANSVFRAKISGTIGNRVYSGTRVNIDELVNGTGLQVEKVPADREGDITWEWYSDEAGSNQLAEAPKDAGTYWLRATVEADSNYRASRSNVIPFTIEQRPLTIERVAVEQEKDSSRVTDITEVFFKGLVGEADQLTINEDYTVVFSYNHEDIQHANELEVKVTLEVGSEKAANYELISSTYIFKAESHNDIWLTNIGSQEYTGGKTTQSFVLYDGSTHLKEGVDYTVSYKNNVNASEWQLPASSPKNAVVIASEGAGVQLMSVGGTIDLSQIKDPSFNAQKAPQMIIKMKGNYTGTHTIYYQIEKISLTDNADIAVDDLTVTYTGKKQTPIPVVTWKGKKLVNNKDFYVEQYITEKANKTAFTGEANKQTEITLTLVGKGNFTGKKDIKLIIGKKDPALEEISMSKVTVKGVKTLIWDQAAAAAPAGMTQEAISVTYKKDALTYQAAAVSTQDTAGQPITTEYTIRYEKNAAVGTATLILEGTGVDVDGDKLAYIGTRRINFKITGNNISKAQATGLLKSYQYTGEEIQPTQLMSGNEKTVKFTYQANKAAPVTALEEGTHYTVSYLKNINKGTAKLVLTGKAEGGYSGTKKISFKIGADVLGTAEITDPLAVAGDKLMKMPYMKGGSKPLVTVKNQADEVLVYGVDYTVSYKNHTKIANISATKRPTVVIKGKGNYSGTLELHYEIVQKDLKDYPDSVYIVAKDKVESTKKNGWKQSFKVYDADGKVISTADYDKNAEYKLTKVPENTPTTLTKDQVLTDPTTVVPAGSEITVSVTMKGSNYKGTVSQTYRILQTGYDISKATIQINPQEYTGKEVLIEKQEDLKKAVLKNGKELKNLYLVAGEENQKQNIQVVSYEKNINKGTAKVTFEGIGEYGGTKTVTFKIGQRSITQWFNDMYSTWQWYF
ncbi:MAG: hypothetical protein ACI4DN_07515 [Lachnospiraceae bacterium]